MKIDDYIANEIVEPFRKIHPNFITLLGIACNFVIMVFLFQKNILMANVFLIVRFLCDILDGAVARRYSKTSRFGGYLDTVNDIMLITFYCAITIWAATTSIAYAACGFLVSLFILLSYFVYHDSLSDHTNLKSGKTNFIEKTIEFGVNNSVLLYAFMLYFNEVYLKGRL